MKCDCRVVPVIGLLHKHNRTLYIQMSSIPSGQSSENLYAYCSDVIGLETLLDFPSRGKMFFWTSLMVTKVVLWGWIWFLEMVQCIQSEHLVYPESCSPASSWRDGISSFVHCLWSLLRNSFKSVLGNGHIFPVFLSEPIFTWGDYGSPSWSKSWRWDCFITSSRWADLRLGWLSQLEHHDGPQFWIHHCREENFSLCYDARMELLATVLLLRGERALLKMGPAEKKGRLRNESWHKWMCAHVVSV